jgi:hypothetical protein
LTCPARERATEFKDEGAFQPLHLWQKEAVPESNVESNVLHIDQYYKKKIEALRNRASKGVLEIGEHLTEVRDVLDHEEFASWVKYQCGWPEEIAERIAQKYMQAYKEYGLDAEKFQLESLCQSASNFDPSYCLI